MRAVTPPEFIDPDPFTVFPVILMFVAPVVALTKLFIKCNAVRRKLRFA